MLLRFHTEILPSTDTSTILCTVPPGKQTASSSSSSSLFFGLFLSFVSTHIEGAQKKLDIWTRTNILYDGQSRKPQVLSRLLYLFTTEARESWGACKWRGHAVSCACSMRYIMGNRLVLNLKSGVWQSSAGAFLHCRRHYFWPQSSIIPDIL